MRLYRTGPHVAGVEDKMKLIYILEVLFLTIETIKDIKTQTVGVWELLIFLIIGFILKIFWFQESLCKVILSMLVGVIMLVISYLSREALGYGDGMVVLVTGVLCGIKLTLITICNAFFVMSVLAVYLFIRKGLFYKEKVPFVPCILVGFLGGLFL